MVFQFLWDADVSNNGFMQTKGLALLLDDKADNEKDTIKPDMAESNWDANKRQQLYENLTTEDDHLMHIFGMEKIKSRQGFLYCKKFMGKDRPL